MSFDVCNWGTLRLTVECFEEDLFQTDMKFEEKIEEKNLHCLERNVMSDQLRIDLLYIWIQEELR